MEFAIFVTFIFAYFYYYFYFATKVKAICAANVPIQQ